MKALNRLTTRRFPATDVYTIDQARELSLLSRALGRQLGMLIDRKGRVDMVLVGEAGGILIPELPRARSGADRLRGLRLLHTHLTPDGLSQEDLMDLLFLRLDAIIVLTVNPDGDPVQWQEAHLLPTPVAGQPYRVEQLRPWDQTSAHFTATAEALEEELAEWLGYSRALLFISGFAANQAVIAAMMAKEDRIAADRLSHASLL